MLVLFWFSSDLFVRGSFRMVLPGRFGFVTLRYVTLEPLFVVSLLALRLSWTFLLCLSAMRLLLFCCVSLVPDCPLLINIT